MKKMSRIFAAAAVLLSLNAFVFAETYVCANDLDSGEVTAETKLEDGFVLHASAEKNLSIGKMPALTTTDKAETFTKRIKLNGAGSKDFRSISFPAKKDQVVTVNGGSSSKTDVRTILVINEAGDTVATLDMNPEIEGGTSTTASFTVPADGTYFIWSKKSGINVYEIVVK